MKSFTWQFFLSGKQLLLWAVFTELIDNAELEAGVKLVTESAYTQIRLQIFDCW